WIPRRLRHLATYGIPGPRGPVIGPRFARTPLARSRKEGRAALFVCYRAPTECGLNISRAGNGKKGKGPMNITTAMTSVPKPAAALIAAFREAPTPIISDNLERLPGAVGLRPFHRTGSRMVGAAFTVRTRPGDNLAIHKALELVGPGDVIVVDGGGDETRALVGEIMKNIAEYRGAAGYVIDGAIRDVAAFAASDFPCFARSAIHRGPYKSGPGEINVPVSIG